MQQILITAAAGVLVAAASAASGFWAGDTYGAGRVQQAWDKDKTTRAQATTTQVITNSEKASAHASQSTTAVDRFVTAQAPAAADAAARIADARRLQRDADRRADRYRAMSKASEAERDRLASYAAGLDASLAEGRLLAEELRATLVDRDNRIRLLADTIRADRILCGATDPGAEP
ncbi:hypothetical protein DBA29_22525 [Xenophilus aerolatus]|nr:hypothetical protein [Xenophilus aerolatus]